MNVETKQLVCALQKIIKKIESDDIKNYKIDTDYYWIVLTKDWDNLQNEPTVAVGSLEDDWESLVESCENDFISYVDYDRLASILRAVSQNVS